MKTFMVIAITAAAVVLGTGVAHAAPTKVFDLDKYTDELKQHGLVEGQDYPDPNTAIVMGLNACNGVAAHGGSRDAYVNTFNNSSGVLARGMAHEVAIETDAAIDVFCPQFKGH